MSLDLIPRRVLSFPSLAMPDFWDDNDNWMVPSTQSGLSISEDDTHVYVEAAVPGIDPKDVEITYQDGYVWIRGEAQEQEEDKKKKFYRQKTSSFSYRVAVPGEIDQNAEPEANYKHGIMTISFAKAPKVQPKKIAVKKVE